MAHRPLPLSWKSMTRYCKPMTPLQGTPENLAARHTCLPAKLRDGTRQTATKRTQKPNKTLPRRTKVSQKVPGLEGWGDHKTRDPVRANLWGNQIAPLSAEPVSRKMGLASTALRTATMLLCPLGAICLTGLEPPHHISPRRLTTLHPLPGRRGARQACGSWE